MALNNYNSLKYTIHLLLGIFILSMSSCREENQFPKVESSYFGTTADGDEVQEYTLENNQGMVVKVISYGGIITSLEVPNDKGAIGDVVLGFNELKDYQEGSPYFGALIGRYGNRIANAAFDLEGFTYQLAANNGVNHLHGGLKGFDKVVWQVESKETEQGPSLILNYLSADMEEGYPGNLSVEVVYLLTDQNELKVSYSATTDKKTVVNLTQHSYFNLSGDFSKDILDHRVQILADKFLPVDNTLIPTGDLTSVKGTPFDFLSEKTIGKEIEHEDEQLIRGLGYDHCFVLNNFNKGMRLAAKVIHSDSGRVMEVFTDQPAIQFYTGNFLDGTLSSKQGGVYNHRTGFCLETQHYPDSPNQNHFPSTVLDVGEHYQTQTIYKFSVLNE